MEALRVEQRVSLRPGSLGVIVMEDSGNKYEGQIGSRGMEGLGALIFESGGSYAGRVRQLTTPCLFSSVEVFNLRDGQRRGSFCTWRSCFSCRVLELQR